MYIMRNVIKCSSSITSSYFKRAGEACTTEAAGGYNETAASVQQVQHTQRLPILLETSFFILLTRIVMTGGGGGGNGNDLATNTILNIIDDKLPFFYMSGANDNQ